MAHILNLIMFLNLLLVTWPVQEAQGLLAYE